jgi:hypothetical protein
MVGVVLKKAINKQMDDKPEPIIKELKGKA